MAGYLKPGSLPAAKKEYVISFADLSGGLNLYHLDYMLPANESPEMKNLHWKDGALGCRPGQDWLVEGGEGVGYSAFEALFHGHAFCHIGDGLYCCDMAAQTPALVRLCGAVPENRGTFFRFGPALYYKNRGGYLRVDWDGAGFSAAAVEPYTPVTLINADPATHAGDLYQPENRLSDRKTVWYNASEGAAVYHLPVENADGVEAVVVDGNTLSQGTDYTVDLAAGTVTFQTPPAVSEPFAANTVHITYRKADADTYRSVMDCHFAAVYGGDQNVCVVLGGSSAQPNAYFWSGNHAVMDPGYFPMEQYNLAGDASEAITGFGRQQNMLVVFKKRSIGRADFGTTTTGGERVVIEMPYTAINSRIGCDLPHSIQLVENNLVFANREQGVHLLLDSTSAYENNVVSLSQKVNGSPTRKGLLAAVRALDEDSVCSFDDGAAYWLVADGQAYLWDYALSAWKNPSWFYYTNVHPVTFFRDDADGRYHLGAQGGITRLDEGFSDYGGAIEKVYQFPTQMMGSYDRVKDVRWCLFAVRSDTDSDTRVRYITDYETREDLTPIVSYTWRLTPRNLAYRFLGVQRFAHIARRQPDCRHVRHFAMRLENDKPGQDLSVVYAQIFYTFQGRER